MNTTPEDIIHFWSVEIGEKRWFNGGPELDATITQRFRAVWDAAKRGELSAWADTATGTLALILVLDQFPRNMFRDHADAFSTDTLARAIAEQAIEKGFDRELPENLRAFIYMPFMHGEDIADQDKSVALFAGRLGKGSTNYPFALKHRDQIVRFGRFPSRNAALGRQSTPEEVEFFAQKRPSDT